MAFPEGFVWGAAAASYQIEGGARDDGKGPSVWDRFSHQDGAVFHGHTGDVACDHYHRYEEDVALMKKMGLQAYRLSVSWPRVLPDGVGAVNEAGLAFYDKLIDALLAADIQPYVTLFHWDYPLALFERGGWLNRDSADWFAEYAGLLGRKLGDRVQHWMTFNEPGIHINMGHEIGEHAPGLKMDWTYIARMVHHYAMAHGKAARALDAEAKLKPQISIASTGLVGVPASDSAEDLAAARALTLPDAAHFYSHRLWLDPIAKGVHVPGVAALLEGSGTVQPGDMEVASGRPMDFLGFNLYWGQRVHADADGAPVMEHEHPGHPFTLMHWSVVPEGLYWAPRFLHEAYGLPIMVTENGLSNMDWVAADGRVHDPQRIDFTRRYLLQFRKAGEDGVPLKGYLHWSLMDNFEWARGYQQRFGLIHVDYVTLKRTLKDSAYWYRDLIASHGALLDTVPDFAKYATAE